MSDIDTQGKESFPCSQCQALNNNNAHVIEQEARLSMRKQTVFFDKADAHEGFVSSCGCKILIVKEEDSWGVYYKIAGYAYEYAYGLTLETPYPEVCTQAVKNAGYYSEVLFSE